MHWEGESINEALLLWCSSREFKDIQAFPLIISWGIWLAKNQYIFNDRAQSPTVIAVNAIGILAHFLQHKEALWIHQVQ